MIFLNGRNFGVMKKAKLFQNSIYNLQELNFKIFTKMTKKYKKTEVPIAKVHGMEQILYLGIGTHYNR